MHEYKGVKFHLNGSSNFQYCFSDGKWNVLTSKTYAEAVKEVHKIIDKL